MDQQISVSDIIAGGEGYAVDFSVDVKCENPDASFLWSASLYLQKTETIIDDEEEEIPPIEVVSTAYYSAFGGDKNTGGWKTFKSTMLLPPETTGFRVSLVPACNVDKCESGDGGSDESGGGTTCATATWFDNVSVVIRKVDDDGKPNTTSRVAAPAATPGAAYDLGGRQVPAGGRGVAVRDGRLTMRK